MVENKPIVVSIAGHDPSGGAGITADLKTIHQLGGYAFSVLTGNTIQNDTEFVNCVWMPLNDMVAQLTILAKRHAFSAVKIGIVPSWQILHQLVENIRKAFPQIPIVVDPVLKASAGFTFHEANFEELIPTLKQITLLTPNLDELKALQPHSTTVQIIEQLVAHTNVLVKGGHDEINKGTDVLYQKNGEIHEITPFQNECLPKHGSGCVLSSAIATHLALNKPLLQAVSDAKRYTEDFLNSNPSQLGFHG